MGNRQLVTLLHHDVIERLIFILPMSTSASVLQVELTKLMLTNHWQAVMKILRWLIVSFPVKVRALIYVCGVFFGFFCGQAAAGVKILRMFLLTVTSYTAKRKLLVAQETDRASCLFRMKSRHHVRGSQ